jgi:hypothetical protein
MARVFKNPGKITFSGEIKRNTEVDNSSAWIEFPYDLKETYGVGNLVPFKANFDGKVTYRGSIAKMGGPLPMILLRKDVREAINKQPGESVEVTIELDDKPREVRLPDDAMKALKEAGVLEIFEKLAYTHRKEYVNWIEEAKKPETRLKRIEKTCVMVAKKSKQ